MLRSINICIGVLTGIMIIFMFECASMFFYCFEPVSFQVLQRSTVIMIVAGSATVITAIITSIRLHRTYLELLRGAKEKK